MSFCILTDTSANLPTVWVRRHDITVIPFSFFIDGKERTCTDVEEFDGKTYYDAMRKGLTVTTSQIHPQRYIEYMKPLLERGKDLLFVGMSSGISGSYASAEMAAATLREEYPERTIRLVDTLGASLGEGLVTLRAAELRAKGKTVDETADALLELRRRICQIFTVDDLSYLRRGGRISHVSAVVGAMLNVKPLLKGDEEGRIVSYGKVRGRVRAIKELVDRFAALAVRPELQCVGISHGDCPEDAAYLEKLLRERCAPREILTVCHEPVTGSHVGPGMLSLFFEGDGDVRRK